MIDEDFLHSLPDDPDEALSRLFASLHSQLERLRAEIHADNYNGVSEEEAERSLLISLFAFIEAYEIPLQLNRQMPADGKEFASYFKSILVQIQYYIQVTTFRRVDRAKSGVGGVYVLTPALKLEMQHYITQIRKIIAETDMTETKREALSQKLNAFATEVDRNRTKIESLAAALVWTRKEIEDGAKNFVPIIDKLTKMFDSMAKATEWIKLPLSKDTKRIEAPPKRIEGPKQEFDDEVPF